MLLTFCSFVSRVKEQHFCFCFLMGGPWTNNYQLYYLVGKLITFANWTRTSHTRSTVTYRSTNTVALTVHGGYNYFKISRDISHRLHQHNSGLRYNKKYAHLHKNPPSVYSSLTFPCNRDAGKKNNVVVT